MKSILISIQPYWVFLIIAKAMGWNIDKKKTVEIRKNYPKAENWDKTVKVYCSKDKKSFAKIPKEYQFLMQPLLGKIIGVFVCDKITVAECGNYTVLANLRTMLDVFELLDYADEKTVYGLHISNLVIYDKPKELSEFFLACNKPKGTDCSVCYERRENRCKSLERPPQSWCYVEVLK